MSEISQKPKTYSKIVGTVFYFFSINRDEKFLINFLGQCHFQIFSLKVGLSPSKKKFLFPLVIALQK